MQKMAGQDILITLLRAVFESHHTANKVGAYAGDPDGGNRNPLSFVSVPLWAMRLRRLA
jgi:hypothetical protein